MQAMIYESFGPATEVLSLIDVPSVDPAAGEVRVRLAYSGVNPSDVKARAGARPGVTAPPFPQICPHSDGAGTIDAVGPGVDTARIGERVWIWNGQWQRPWGTAAQSITLPSEQAVPLPKAASFETGASLGIPGLTAAHTVFGAGDITGQTLLIHGGNGSVGHLALQLAKWGGARVITTARPEANNRCLGAGADIVLDYRAPDLADQVLAANNGVYVDRIIDVEFGSNVATNAQVIAPNGTIAVFGSARNMSPEIPFGPLLFKAVTIDIALIYILTAAKRAAAVSRLHAALSEDALTCPVAEVFHLAETPQAHISVETGARAGAILVDTSV